MSTKPDSSPSFALSVVMFLSGVCALTFELVWSRYLVLIFGASVFAATTVLACFMFGMALGSWWIGRVVDRVEHGLPLLVWLNVAIGIYGLLSPLIFAGAAHLNVLIFTMVEATPTLKTTVRFLIAFVVLIVPTLAMGGILPTIVKLITRRAEDVGKETSHAYWIVTLGGALGAFLTGFLLIRVLGLRGTTFLASLASLCAGGLAYLYLRPPAASHARIRERRVERSAAGGGVQRRLILAVLGLSGFTSLAYEVYFTRLLTLFFRDSAYDLAIVLTAFLCGLALGSALCGRFLLNRREALPLLAGVEALIGLGALVGLALISRLPAVGGYLQSMPAFHSEYGDGYWTAATAIKFGYAFLVILLPTCFSGMTFPLVSALWVRDVDRLGTSIGILNGTNTLGSTLGALLAGFVFVSVVGTHTSIILTALLNIGLALLLLTASEWPRKHAALAGVALVSAVAIYLVPRWDNLTMSTTFVDPAHQKEHSLSLLYYSEDAYGFISVAEAPPLGTRLLTTNRLYSQNTSAMTGLEDHRRLGYIPLMLHPKPRDVLVIGLGAGITLRGVTEHPGVAAIDCVEISEGVRQAARYFAAENDHVLDNPKVRFVIEDGRNFISTSRRQYDVIVADLFFPMSSGSSAVFSREHFEASKARLKPGGVMAQWLPAHQMSIDEIKIVARTFQTVFPHTSIWYGMIGSATPAVGLIGTERRLEIDPVSLRALYADRAFAQKAGETILDDPYMFMSNFILEGDTLRALTEASPINSDDRPIVEFTNPLLYDRFTVRGRENLLRFHEWAQDIRPYIKPGSQSAADLDAIQLGMDRLREGIRGILLNSD